MNIHIRIEGEEMQFGLGSSTARRRLKSSRVCTIGSPLSSFACAYIYIVFSDARHAHPRVFACIRAWILRAAGKSAFNCSVHQPINCRGVGTGAEVYIYVCVCVYLLVEILHYCAMLLVVALTRTFRLVKISDL